MNKKACLILFVLLVFILVQYAAAADWIGGILWPFKKLGHYLIEALVRIMMVLLRSYVNMIEASILSNPDVSIKTATCGVPITLSCLTPHGRIIAMFLTVLVPIHILGIIITAIYMIFISESPQGRAHAKAMLEKLLVSMVIVSASPAIYMILLYTSEVIARGVLGVITGTIMKETTVGEAMYTAIADMPIQTKITFIIVFVFILLACLFALLIIWFRYLMVMLCAIIFPFTLFLYMFEFTRHLGSRMLKFTIVWIYTPIIAALWLAIGVVILKTTTEQQSFIADIVAPIFFMATMVLIAIAPLVMSGLLKWLGGILSMVGMLIPGWWGMALAAVGGIMQGRGASALTLAGARAGWGKIGGALRKSKGVAKAAKKTAAGPKPEEFKAGGGADSKARTGAGGKAGTGAAGKAGTGAKAGAKGKAAAVKGAGKAAGKATEAGARGLGSAIGGAIGSVIPGAGTAAGARLGGRIGGAVGKVAGKAVEGGVKAAAATGKAAKWGAKGADWANPAKAGKGLYNAAKGKFGKPQPPSGKSPLSKAGARAKSEAMRDFKEQVAYGGGRGRPDGPSAEQVMDGLDPEAG